MSADPSRPGADVSALILAGGKATRFGGIAKHELVVDGETIFARQVRVLAPRVAEILVSSPREIAGYRTVSDLAEGVGPLAGIAAGLAACRTDWLLVLAGDMPYVTGKLIDQIMGPSRVPRVAPSSDRTDLVVVSDPVVCVRLAGLPEPLLCMLHRSVLPIVERRIAAGRYKASGLVTDEGLRVRWIDDADPAALRNVNSPEDLRR